MQEDTNEKSVEYVAGRMWGWGLIDRGKAREKEETKEYN